MKTYKVVELQVHHSQSRLKAKLGYDRQLVDQSVLVSSTHLTTTSQSQSHFMTRGLPPISSSWPQTKDFFWQLNSCCHSPSVPSSLTRGWLCLWRISFTFVKCTYRTYSMLLKILTFALYASPLSVQALQSRSCLPYVSYATTEA
jgi:hypothetical protein